MPFTDPIVADTDLVRTAIRSPNYVSGTSGWTINQDGSAEFTNIQVTVTGTNSGLQIVRSSDGAVVGSISEDGIISGSALTLSADDVEIAGQQLSARLANQAASILAWGIDTSSALNTTTELGVFEVAFDAPVSKYYQLAIGAWLAGPAGGLAVLLIRDGGVNKPSLSSPSVFRVGHGLTVTAAGEQFGQNAPLYLTAGVHRLLLTFGRYGGATGTYYLVSAGDQPAYIQVMDTPPALANVAVANSGGGGSSTSVQTYTIQWVSTWSATYDGGNNYSSWLGSEAHQGSYDGTAGNNRRSLIGFDSATIASTLSGATILGCQITLYAYHWYWNAGGTAIIGTHGHASQPGTWSGTPGRVTSSSWPKPGMRAVDLGTTIGAEFQAGTTKGLALGPGPTNNVQYYGKFSGAGMVNQPVLTITYQK
jgi:hypothetical protein